MTEISKLLETCNWHPVNGCWFSSPEKLNECGFGGGSSCICYGEGGSCSYIPDGNREVKESIERSAKENDTIISFDS